MVVESLKQFSIDPVAESVRLGRLNPLERQRVFSQNLEAYVNEVIRDEPVSILYNYWLDDNGEVFTDPSRKDIYNLRWQIDPRERCGLIINGINYALRLAVINPNNLVGLYSPAGPAAFDQDPANPYSKITFNYGQLYLLYFDGEKINNVAVKVSKEGEGWVDEIVRCPSMDKDIASYIQTPRLLGNVDNFINKHIDSSNRLVYKGRDKSFYLNDVFGDVKAVFAGGQKLSGITLRSHGITEEHILNTYLSLIRDHLVRSGKDSIALQGSCGGSQTTFQDIEELLRLNTTPFDNAYQKLISSFSTTFRVFGQTEEKYDYHDGECCICHQKVKVGPCDICKKCETKFD